MLGKTWETESHAAFVACGSFIAEVHFKDCSRCVGRFRVARDEWRPTPHANVNRRVRLIFNISDGVVTPILAFLHRTAHADIKRGPVVPRIMLGLAGSEDPRPGAGDDSQIRSVQGAPNGRQVIED